MAGSGGSTKPPADSGGGWENRTYAQAIEFMADASISKMTDTEIDKLQRMLVDEIGLYGGRGPDRMGDQDYQRRDFWRSRLDEAISEAEYRQERRLNSPTPSRSPSSGSTTTHRRRSRREDSYLRAQQR